MPSIDSPLLNFFHLSLDANNTKEGKPKCVCQICGSTFAYDRYGNFECEIFKIRVSMLLDFLQESVNVGEGDAATTWKRHPRFSVSSFNFLAAGRSPRQL